MTNCSVQDPYTVFITTSKQPFLVYHAEIWHWAKFETVLIQVVCLQCHRRPWSELTEGAKWVPNLRTVWSLNDYCDFESLRDWLQIPKRAISVKKNHKRFQKTGKGTCPTLLLSLSAQAKGGEEADVKNLADEHSSLQTLVQISRRHVACHRSVYR